LSKKTTNNRQAARSFFHYIAFPEREMLDDIVKIHYPDFEKKLLDQVLTLFYSLREFQRKDAAVLGSLLKNEQDYVWVVEYFEV